MVRPDGEALVGDIKHDTPQTLCAHGQCLHAQTRLRWRGVEKRVAWSGKCLDHAASWSVGLMGLKLLVPPFALRGLIVMLVISYIALGYNLSYIPRYFSSST